MALARWRKLRKYRFAADVTGRHAAEALELANAVTRCVEDDRGFARASGGDDGLGRAQ
jgi:hypothetical protein